MILKYMEMNIEKNEIYQWSNNFLKNFHSIHAYSRYQDFIKHVLSWKFIIEAKMKGERNFLQVLPILHDLGSPAKSPSGTTLWNFKEMSSAKCSIVWLRFMQVNAMVSPLQRSLQCIQDVKISWARTSQWISSAPYRRMNSPTDFPKWRGVENLYIPYPKVKSELWSILHS